MRPVARGLVAVAVATLFSLLAACDETLAPPVEPGARDSVNVNYRGTVVRTAYLVCPGGSDARASAMFTAAVGGTVTTPGTTAHQLTVPPGALAVSAFVHFMEVEHTRHMKVRAGTDPSQTLADSVTFTFDLRRCRTRPARLDLVREDNATFAGSADVSGTTVTFSVGELSTYVLAAPGR